MRQLDGREDFQANKDVRKIWKVVRSSSWLREDKVLLEFVGGGGAMKAGFQVRGKGGEGWSDPRL